MNKKKTLKEIFEGIEKVYDSKRINIPLIQLFFWLFTELKPKLSCKERIKKMVGDKK